MIVLKLNCLFEIIVGEIIAKSPCKLYQGQIAADRDTLWFVASLYAICTVCLHVACICVWNEAYAMAP